MQIRGAPLHCLVARFGRLAGKDDPCVSQGEATSVCASDASPGQDRCCPTPEEGDPSRRRNGRRQWSGRWGTVGSSSTVLQSGWIRTRRMRVGRYSFRDQRSGRRRDRLGKTGNSASQQMAACDSGATKRTRSQSDYRVHHGCVRSVKDRRVCYCTGRRSPSV